jgi:hypothetical protein
VAAGGVKFAVQANLKLLPAGSAEGVPVNLFPAGLGAAKKTFHPLYDTTKQEAAQYEK